MAKMTGGGIGLASRASDGGRESVPRLGEHHLFTRLGATLLYHPRTMLFYEVSPVVERLVKALAADSWEAPGRFRGLRRGSREAAAALAHLEREGFLESAAPRGPTPPPLKKRRGFRHLELMVTHGCNLRCRYCYGSDGPATWEGAPHLYGSHRNGMSLETACAGVDFIFTASGEARELSLVFFGGEPLLELPLIREVVRHVRRRERETGKTAALSLSTNGLLLDEDAVAFLVAERIGCQVSIDGPPDVHDRNRVLPGGGGSYERLIPGVRRLIAARPGRVPARVTVAGGGVRMISAVEHLVGLGFGSVHLEPALGRGAAHALAPADLAQIREQEEALAAFLLSSVRRGRIFNYANTVRHIRQSRVVRERQAHHCGAGRTYLTLSQDGFFYPCHRFVGMDGYRMGNLEGGVDLALQERILGLGVDERPRCRACWARYLCGGGCWSNAVGHGGSLEEPDPLGCEITKHQIECAMAVNARLGIADGEILCDLHEMTAEPHLTSEREGGRRGAA